MPKGHFHTGPIDILIATAGVLVVVHVLRIAAGLMVGHPATASAGKALAAFALSD